MQLYSLQLFSKNNKQRGNYLYKPVVQINGKYFWCNSIKSVSILKPSQIDINALEIQREIPVEYYKANGIK